MMKTIGTLGLLTLMFVATQAVAAAAPNIKKVFVVVLENEDKNQSMEHPFLKKLMAEGASLEDMHGLTHPSYPNYIGLTSGSVWGIDSNRQRTVDATHLGDLFEAKGKSWRTYADGYQGKRGECSLTAGHGKYARRHVPFLSYKNIQESAERCDRIVNSSQLQSDVENGRLADFTLFIPDNDNNGHDTGIAYADRWLAKTFGPLLKDRRFTDGMLFVVTFDEDDGAHRNLIYTTLWGESVVPGATSKTRYDLYSLLRTIEDIFELGTLGRNDAKASRITDIWR